MNCKTFTKQWLRCKNGSLTAEAEAHLATCPDCRAKVHRYQQAISMLKEPPPAANNTEKMQFAVMSRIQNLPPATAHTRNRKLWIAAAASVALLLAGAQITYHHISEVRQDNEDIVDILSDMHAEQYTPRQNTSEYSDLAVIESYL